MLDRPRFPSKHLIRWVEIVGACAGIVLLFFPHTPFAFRFVVVTVALFGLAVIVGHHHGRVREWERISRYLRAVEIDERDERESSPRPWRREGGRARRAA